MYIGIAGLLLAVIGLADIKVTCGNGFSSNLSQAAQTDGHDVVAQRGTALLVRRAWAIPAVAIGWLLVTAFLAIWVHQDQSRDESKKEAVSA